MFDYFTPTTGLLGGSLIGLSAGTLLLLNGDILGFSGIMSSIFTAPKNALSSPSYLWRFTFVVAFMIMSILLTNLANDPRSVEDPTLYSPSAIAYTLAGLFVGFGTRQGNGCSK
jgi:uncharacterized membrane protein YedE/YeeE